MTVGNVLGEGLHQRQCRRHFLDLVDDHQGLAWHDLHAGEHLDVLQRRPRVVAGLEHGLRRFVHEVDVCACVVMASAQLAQRIGFPHLPRAAQHEGKMSGIVAPPQKPLVDITLHLKFTFHSDVHESANAKKQWKTLAVFVKKPTTDRLFYT